MTFSFTLNNTSYTWPFNINIASQNYFHLFCFACYYFQFWNFECYSKFWKVLLEVYFLQTVVHKFVENTLPRWMTLLTSKCTWLSCSNNYNNQLQLRDTCCLQWTVDSQDHLAKLPLLFKMRSFFGKSNLLLIKLNMMLLVSKSLIY